MSGGFRSCRLPGALYTKVSTKVFAEPTHSKLLVPACFVNQHVLDCWLAGPWRPCSCGIGYPLKTGSASAVYIHLCWLAVPFTPTQGICTPSPTNMAAYWYQAQYGYHDPFTMFASSWSPVSIIHAPLSADLLRNMHCAFLTWHDSHWGCCGQCPV